jgi:hypothetical protein
MKSNIDRIQSGLHDISDLAGLALIDLDEGRYEEVLTLLEDIGARTAAAVQILEDNEEFNQK